MYAGTLTLIGVVIGALVGFFLDQIPPGSAAGITVGVALDSLWQNWSMREES